jgi:hypothetical protein
MTLIGRFSLESETIANPSIPTFFIALAGSKPLTAQRFGTLWEERGMEEKHPRFHHAVSPTHRGYFEPTEELQVTDTLFPMVYREDLKYRIQSCLTHPLTVTDALWQVQITSGKMGKSGAIPRFKATRLSQQFPDYQESILLFRGHHALADGVSLTAAFSDLCDEAQDIRDAIHREIKRRRGPSQTMLQKLARFCKRLAWFCYGSIQAMLHYLYLLLFTPDSPFDSLRELLPPSKGRTVSWCDAAPLDQVKQVAHSMGPRVTVNDVMVSCVTYAVARQLEQHRRYLETVFPNKGIQQTHSTINVVIPVHLGGGVLLPGQAVGNNIGAFCAQVPGESTDDSAESRLQQVHDSLYTVKNTPAPFLSFLFAKMASSTLPPSITKRLFETSQAHACVAITNNRGSSNKLHLDGQEIQSIAGFLPLPPGIPIGVSVTSYAGTVSLSVTAEPWAVPNADQFLMWVLEEYSRLQRAAEKKSI